MAGIRGLDSAGFILDRHPLLWRMPTRKNGGIFMKNQFVLLSCTFLFGVMVGIHRRVIKSLVTGSPMPEAPASHIWVKNRKEA